ncbi:chemotaxis protein CheB [Alcanivorax sp. 1008]|uniref:chemotaxis protein CheB n=1 Tax=Alcanivorax sp. 1008 TaxID=2816853 RepID=UPI001DE99A50|nr:chemotaxis protein CheB [Alcanivorax sp. 1008]MCC1495914.1 chemotaxis protein CheB [Alcanivorax sp. 1008]
MTSAGPRIGIIADTTLQGHLLSSAVRGQGYNVVVNSDPGSIEQSWLTSGDLDLWVVDLNHEDRWQDFLDHLLEGTPVPILFSDGQAPARNSPLYPRWERRLLSKMLDYVGRPQVDVKLESLAPAKPAISIPTPSEFRKVAIGPVPERVWVLGASLGGPAAVKVFLDCLPAELPVAFILAQHIDSSFLETLAGVLCRDNSFACRVGYDGEQLSHGTVLIAPVEYEVAFTETGRLMSTGKPWEGPYSPSIDQVINNVSSRFADRAGAILFSGMGNDGSIAGPAMKGRGGPVWAQSADSCACSSQPDSVRDTGCVSYSGTPEKLALALVEYVRQDIRRGLH